MFDADLSSTGLLSRGLLLAALTPGLRSILIYDADPLELRTIAATLRLMLKIVENHTIEQVSLGSTTTEEDLWGTLSLQNQTSNTPLTWKQGLLEQQSDRRLRLVLIPKLAQLSLAASRACVTLIGADSVCVERYGHQRRWQPNICWLACCNRDEIGHVSPHLVDRFALRLSSQAEIKTDRAAQIIAWISKHKSGNSVDAQLPGDIQSKLKAAIVRWPDMTNESIARVLEYFSASDVYNPRRAIALARLAHANARLEGTSVTADHVDVAAQIIDLRTVTSYVQTATSSPTSTKKPSGAERTTEPPTIEQIEGQSANGQGPEDPVSTSVTTTLVYQSDTPKALDSYQFPSNLVQKSATPYLEDNSLTERDIASLQLPRRRYRPNNAAKGPVTGTIRATSIHDLALVSTILEAAKFQSIRRANRDVTNGQFLLSPTDWLSYRRASLPEQMLMLLLDYTCLSNSNWEEALFPYLKWAYIERTSLCIIQVGGINAVNELRAEHIMSQSILSPLVSGALEEKPGKASPLAHGLDIALQTIQHMMQHGRGTIEHIRFVILTDGRGNVPLEASRNGHLLFPNKPTGVQRRGIEDSLEVAHMLSSIKGVKIILLNPHPRQYPELPLELGKALAATVVGVEDPLFEEEEQA